MSRPKKVRHRCEVCGRQEWLVRRPEGQAWEFAHWMLRGDCPGRRFVPVTDSDISSGKSSTR